MSTYCQLPFSSSTWKRGGTWMCKLGVISQEWFKIEVKLLLSANRKSLIGTTMDDLVWPFHASCAISAVAELLVCNLSKWRKIWSAVKIKIMCYKVRKITVQRMLSTRLISNQLMCGVDTSLITAKSCLLNQLTHPQPTRDLHLTLTQFHCTWWPVDSVQQLLAVLSHGVVTLTLTVTS